MRRHVAALLAVAGLLSAAGVLEPSTQSGSTVLPERFERYLTSVVKPSVAERRRLLHGGPITKLVEADASQEVAVFGAIWIDAPPQRYVDAVKDIESFERGGGFRKTKRISTPPQLEDFGTLELPAEDVTDLRTCRVGSCALKLGRQSIDLIRARVDFRRPTAKDDVEAVFRERMLHSVTEYRERGNAGLSVYRDNSRPTFVAAEFASMVDGMPSLTDFLPDLRRYLLEYPAAGLPNSTDFLYWQEVQFGLKPTIRISHLVIQDGPTVKIVASKMLYASHYFWTGLELRVLAPDPARGAGFWFITVNRSRSDGLSGFTGFFVRRRVQNEVERGVLAGLTATKARLETAGR